MSPAGGVRARKGKINNNAKNKNMRFQEIIVTVRITCPGQAPFDSRVDVVQIAGMFDTGMVLTEVHRNHPGCRVEILNVEWVVDKSN